MIKLHIDNLNINKIKESLSDAPSEVAINIIVNGNTAKKLLLLKEIMLLAMPDLDEDMIYKYLFTVGVNKELEKFSDD
jgi:hypothetical protein